MFAGGDSSRLFGNQLGFDFVKYCKLGRKIHPSGFLFNADPELSDVNFALSALSLC